MSKNYISSVSDCLGEIILYESLTGTGKTAIMRDKLAALDTDSTVTAGINMNSLSDAPSLQFILEQHLEKKSGELMQPCTVHGLGLWRFLTMHWWLLSTFPT